MAAAVLPLHLFALDPAPAGPPALAGSAIFDWDALAGKRTSAGFSRPVADSPIPTMARFEMHVTTLNPGKPSHPPHNHPQEELVLVKEGTLESSINGQKDRIGAGSLLFFAAHDVHNVTNIGETPATYYVINFYTAATATVRDQPAADWAPSGMLRSSVVHWEALDAKPNAVGVRRSYVNSPTLTFANLEIHASTVNPGAPASAAHRHPWLELVIIRDGSLEVSLDGRKQTAGPGSIVYMAPNALQSTRNPGTVPTTYVVFAVSSAATGKASDN